MQEARQAVLAQPWWLDWTAGLFPVILIVFLLRSFLFEPFKIPSGSMVPTLTVGDLILVNKFHYGVRLPVINKKIIANHDPERGDVMVFRYPVDPRVDYIKRVVGVPGDEVAYLNQRLSINGKPVELKAQGEYYDDDAGATSRSSRSRWVPSNTASWSTPSAPPTMAAATRGSFRMRRTAATQPRAWCARFPRATTS